MLHLGLLITKDDDEIIEQWFQDNSGFFDGLVCLDGSRSNRTYRAAQRFSNVVYANENSVKLVHRTDHGLRLPAHDLLVQQFGTDCWITLCHADEFFYHDPRQCCMRAELEGATGIYWYAVHFVPHPNELAQWDVLRHLPITQRFRYYHWDVAGSQAPWLEFRSYRNGPAVEWEPCRHGSTQPSGCHQLASFHPAYRHFKVYSLDQAFYEVDQGCTRFRHHWQGVAEGRTGIPWVARQPKDFFVSELPPYMRCDYFRGRFDHSWNMGEEFR